MRGSVNLLATRKQSVYCSECVVRTAPHRIPRCSDGCRSRRSGSEPDKLLERSVEWIEYPIELNSHLKAKSPARDVIGRSRRPTRIRNVVGMILRLEHVDDVRPERLRGFYDVGAGGIILPGYRERASCPLNIDSILHESVHKLHCGRKIRLVRRNDVATRITRCRRMKQRNVRLGFSSDV